jgi:hypothetical protein
MRKKAAKSTKRKFKKKTKSVLKSETMTTPKIKFNFGLKLKRAIFALVALLLVLSQSQVLSAFEAHVINVTATIRNDIPSADPPTGEFCADDTNTVILSVTLPGAYIWYTMDGSDPVCDGNGQQYTGPITLPIGITTIKARSCHDEKQSSIVSWTYDVAYEYCEQVCDPNIELVTNGGFETPVVGTPQLWDIFTTSQVPGWSIEWMAAQPPYQGLEQPVDAYLELHRGVNGWLPYEGSQHAELDTDWDGPSGSVSGEPASVKIYQDISTIPGENYTIKFYFSPRPSTDAANNQLQFSWAGSIEDTISGAGGSNTNWFEHSYTFTAISATTRLQFADVGIPSDSLGTFLDNVSVRCQPCSPNNEHLTINEVYYDVKCHGEEGWNEWVEIYNPTDAAVDISGWVIQDNNSSDVIPSSPPIPADGFAVITPMATTWGYWPSIPAGAIKIVLGSKIGDGLNNDGDRVILKDVSGAEIDAVSYGTDTYAFSPSVPDVAEGHSIARSPKGFDTNQASDWVDLSWPTPGTNPHSDGDTIIPAGEEIGCASGQVYVPEDRDTSEDPEETEGASILGEPVDGDIPGEENSDPDVESEEESNPEDEIITGDSSEENSSEETSEEETASDNEGDETANNEGTESGANSEGENNDGGETNIPNNNEPAAVPNNEQSGRESGNNGDASSSESNTSEGNTSGGQTGGDGSVSSSGASSEQSGNESTTE